MEKYGDDIQFSSKFGSNSLICFAKKHHEILTKDWYNQKLKNDSEEELRLLKAAGEIIRRHIKSKICLSEFYASSDKFFDNVNESIPYTLLFFVREIILKDKKGGHQ